MKLKHFLQFNDLSKDDIYYLFQRAKWLKDQFKNYKIEIVIINDSSPDSTHEKSEILIQRYPNIITYLKLSKNFEKVFEIL